MRTSIQKRAELEEAETCETPQKDQEVEVYGELGASQAQRFARAFEAEFFEEAVVRLPGRDRLHPLDSLLFQRSHEQSVARITLLNNHLQRCTTLRSCKCVFR